MYPEFVAAGGPEAGLARRRAPARSSAATLADRFGWKIGDRVPLQSADLAAQRRAGPGSSTSSASTTARRRAPTPPASSSATTISTRPAQRGKGQVGWYTRPREGPGPGGGGRQARSTRNSPTRPTKPRPSRRARSPQGFAQQIGNIGTIVDRHPQRGVLHHPAGGRQHHGPGGARTDRGTGRAQGDRLHQRTGAGAGAGRVVPDRRCSADWPAWAWPG